MTNIQTKSRQIIDHHFKSFLANDLEEIMKDYTDESMIITPKEDFLGLVQIKELFTTVFRQFPSIGTKVVIEKLVAEENMGYVVWHGETPELFITFSTATYIFKEGKIIKHTIGRVTRRK